MMTQLDRLEALLRMWKEDGKRYYGVANIEGMLPDLIRVARATRNLAWNEIDGPCWCPELPELTKTHTSVCLALREATAPLFAEVES